MDLPTVRKGPLNEQPLLAAEFERLALRIHCLWHQIQIGRIARWVICDHLSYDIPIPRGVAYANIGCKGKSVSFLLRSESLPFRAVQARARQSKTANGVDHRRALSPLKTANRRDAYIDTAVKFEQRSGETFQ